MTSRPAETQAHQMQDVVFDDSEPTLSIVLWQFLQPLTFQTLGILRLRRK